MLPKSTEGGLTFVWRLLRAVDLDVKVAEVVFVWDGTNTRDTRGEPINRKLSQHESQGDTRLRHQAFGLLDNALWESHLDKGAFALQSTSCSSG